MSMKQMLDDEIVFRLSQLREADAGTEQDEAKVNTMLKLMDRSIELKKIESDVEEQNKRRDDEKRDHMIRNIMTGVKDVAIIGVTIWGTVAAFNFEKEGTITSSAGRKHLNKVLSWFK